MSTIQSYSVPKEAHQLFVDGVVNNPLHASAPKEIYDAVKYVSFTGGDLPVIPINWRFAESISALKGYEAAMLNVLLMKKYGEYQKVVIDTDHAQLFIMSILLFMVDPNGRKITGADQEEMGKLIKDHDLYKAFDGSHFKSACTNIYKTKDGRCYHLHGSMNAAPTQLALGFSESTHAKTFEDACALYQEKVQQYTASEIETLMNDDHRQAGTTCWSTEEYKASPHGRANAHVGLYQVHHIENPNQLPGWWTPVQDKTTLKRPLFGLKVIDLTRVIASPAITRGLAELGASVLRITSPNVTDITGLALDLGWGKWNAHLDLKSPADRQRLKKLILEADIVVDGYRPGVMEKWGFGKDDILGLFAQKEKGVIYVHENCYGWQGPWAGRSGWQQISDANTGVSLEFGRAMGKEEAVTPVFPNSDFCTGVAGTTGVLQALIERAEKGGSFVVDVALNYYSQWLVNTCSTYSESIWDYIWGQYGRPVFRHTDNMSITWVRYMKMLGNPAYPANARLFQPQFFELRRNGALNVDVRTVKPVLGFPEGRVKLGYNVGSRGNGVDRAQWPEDLMTEVIA